MPKLKCINKDCPKYEQEVFIYRLTSHYDENIERFINDVECSSCGKELFTIPPESYKEVHFINRMSKRYWKT